MMCFSMQSFHVLSWFRCSSEVVQVLYAKALRKMCFVKGIEGMTDLIIQP